MSEYALLTEEQAELKKMIRTVLEKELAPLVKEYDVKSEFPMQVFRKLGEIGLWGMDIPAEYGGPGFDAKTLCLLREEFGRVDAGFSVSFGPSTVGFKIMTAGGSEEQKQTFLRPLVDGSKVGCFGLTEPSAGTDAGGADHPRWKDNLAFALSLQRNLVKGYASLARPTVLRKARYNQQLCPGSVLVEVGGHGNSLSEAIAGGRLWADNVARTLLEMKE